MNNSYHLRCVGTVDFLGIGRRVMGEVVEFGIYF